MSVTEAGLEARLATWGIRPPKKLKGMAHDLFGWLCDQYEDGFVWCDHHGGIHEVQDDVYDEGAEECVGDNWHAVVTLVLAAAEGKET